MVIVQALPPNYDLIARKFYIANNPRIVFTYGDRLYNPGGGPIDDHLLVHEKIHEQQQLTMGVDEWWKIYIEDPEFRLTQEVEAYRAQYSFLKEHYSRAYRRKVLDHICSDLSSPIYGNIVSKKQAKDLITAP